MERNGILPEAWSLLRATVAGYIEDEAMTRGAAIACYSMFSLAPLLVIAMAVAGIVFGEQAVQGLVAEELRDHLGATGAEAVEALVVSAGNPRAGRIATLIGIATLLITASAVFAEVQAALDSIWRVPPPPPERGYLTQILHARIAAFLLVVATGFIMMLSMLASTILSAVATWATGWLPGVQQLLPHRRLDWGDVLAGAVATALLFIAGKSLIGWYLGSPLVAGAYGAAGALLVVLLWIFYSAQVFLLGAEFTRAWTAMRARRRAAAARRWTRQHLGRSLHPQARGGCAMADETQATPDEAAIAAAMHVLDRFMAGLNARDATAVAATLHFPHHRLAGCRWQVWERPGDYTMEGFLARAGEGWARSDWDYRRVVAAGPRKVHLDVQFSRYRADGSVLGRFRSLWMVTCLDGVWGVQGRSSFAD